MRWLKLYYHLARRVLQNPRLALALVQVAWRFRKTDWYKRIPFLPMPDATYIRWRMFTAYGDYNFVPRAADVERYVLWAVEQR
jgi:hypothetical protein